MLGKELKLPRDSGISDFQVHKKSRILTNGQMIFTRRKETRLTARLPAELGDTAGNEEKQCRSFLFHYTIDLLLPALIISIRLLCMLLLYYTCVTPRRINTHYD